MPRRPRIQVPFTEEELEQLDQLRRRLQCTMREGRRVVSLRVTLNEWVRMLAIRGLEEIVKSDQA